MPGDVAFPTREEGFGMLKRVLVGLIGIIAAGLPFAARAGGNETPNLGRVMWSAFQCSNYAELSSNPGEQARLFNVGKERQRRSPGYSSICFR